MLSRPCRYQAFTLQAEFTNRPKAESNTERKVESKTEGKAESKTERKTKLKKRSTHLVPRCSVLPRADLYSATFANNCIDRTNCSIVI